MITRFANLTSRVAAGLVMLCTIAACSGGGGGNSDAGFIPDEGKGALWLGIVMLDAQGQPTNTVTATSPAIIEVTVRRNGKNGKLLADVVVSGSASLGNILPAVGTALSNADGVATFELEVGDLKGAGVFTASASNEDGVTTTETLSYQAGSAGLRLGYFDADGDFIENEIGIQPEGVLAASGNAQLSVAILDEDGNLAGTSESVRFNSGCLSAGESSLSPASPVTSGNGVIATTYTAAGCTGFDEISASLVGANAQAFGTLEIAPATANQLLFVSADPNDIVLKGTGGGPNRQEVSNVVFRAVDASDRPLQGIEVSFSLTTFAGGLSVSPETAITDADGNAQTAVISGDVATRVRVIASTAGLDGSGEVSTVSDFLNVTSGLPEQQSINLSVTGGFVVENAMTRNGITRTLTVSMTDIFNNPVPDGTAASFIAEYGFIPSSCTTTNGTCSVEWSSSDPRRPTLDEVAESIKTINSPGYRCPSHGGRSGPCEDDLGFTRGGRATILVVADGEESFVDRNGNGIMDEDERDLFVNVAEAHVDYNEDGILNPEAQGCKGVDVDDATGACLAGFEEIYLDRNKNGAYDRNNNPAVYNGLLCPPEGNGNWCSRELVHVRDEVVLTLSAGEIGWDFLVLNGRLVAGTINEGVEYKGLVSDIFNSAPPQGSVIAVKADGACNLISPNRFEVPSRQKQGAVAFAIQVDGDGGDGTVTVSLTPNGGGSEYSETFGCTSIAPPDPNAPEDDELVVGAG